MGYLKQLEEEYKQRKEMKEKGLISKSTKDYFSDIKSRINNAFDEERYKREVDALTNKGSCFVRIDPLEAYKTLHEVAEKGVDAYKLFINGTLDDKVLLRHILDSFYEDIVCDYPFSDDILDYVWSFDSIAFDDLKVTIEEQGVDGVKNAIEGEIYEKIVRSNSKISKLFE